MSKRFPHPFKELMNELKQYKTKLPMKVSGIAEKEFKENFTRQGTREEKWKKRKEPDKRKGRSILIKSGRLRRGFKKRPDANTARVVNDVPYADAHNQGSRETVSVKGHSRRNKRTKKKFNVSPYRRKNNLPARPFMTTSKALLDDIENTVLQDVTKIYEAVKTK